LVAIPILFIATLATLELGLLLVVQNSVTAAVIEGAREAAKDNASLANVGCEVTKHLAVHEIDLSPDGGARLRIEGGPAAGELGNLSLNCVPRGNAPNPSQIRATVCVLLHDGSDGPVPDWLSSFGFSLADHRMVVSAIVSRE